MKKGVLKVQLKAGRISQGDYDREVDRLMSCWQDRWDSSDKGRWTHTILLDVRLRVALPLELGYYVTQFLSGHGDFNGKLASLCLVGNGRCRCLKEEETVDHVLFMLRWRSLAV